jgi:glycosyltransferase involved in cell wall biosynthesis
MSKSNLSKLFGVCFVKNEEDIIADSVTHAADFCDRVFVVDNASTDRTWDIVRELKLNNLVPVCSKDFVFRDYLRLRFMETRKEELGLDNWWYIFDADEFLLEEPFEAIAQAEGEGADCIAIGMVNFYLTKDEVRNLQESEREETWRDRKYYLLYESGKIEFIKNTRYLDYGAYDIIPLGLTKECSRRLPIKHYPYRSLTQLEKRVSTRYGNPEFESECKRGTDLERYLIDPAAFPQLRYLDEEKGLDLTSGFDHIVPRIGESLRDRAREVTIRILYGIRLLRAFYAFYHRYAAWRQKVDHQNEPEL